MSQRGAPSIPGGSKADANARSGGLGPLDRDDAVTEDFGETVDQSRPRRRRASSPDSQARSPRGARRRAWFVACPRARDGRPARIKSAKSRSLTSHAFPGRTRQDGDHTNSLSGGERPCVVVRLCVRGLPGQLTDRGDVRWDLHVQARRPCAQQGQPPSCFDTHRARAAEPEVTEHQSELRSANAESRGVIEIVC